MAPRAAGCLAALGLALAAAAPRPTRVPDLDVPGFTPVEVHESAGDRVTVSSQYWRLEFDLRNGGVLDMIVFAHGSGKNVLTKLFRTYVDGWSNANTRELGVRRLPVSGSRDQF